MRTEYYQTQTLLQESHPPKMRTEYYQTQTLNPKDPEP